MKCQCCYHDTSTVSKDIFKFNVNLKHLSLVSPSHLFLFYLIQSGHTFCNVKIVTLVITLTYLVTTLTFSVKILSKSCILVFLAIKHLKIMSLIFIFCKPAD